jgi:hypothetical protein
MAGKETAKTLSIDVTGGCWLKIGKHTTDWKGNVNEFTLCIVTASDWVGSVVVFEYNML